MKKLMIPFAFLIAVSCTKARVTDDNSSSTSSSSSSSSSSSDSDVSAAAVPAVVKQAFVNKFGNLAVRQWKLRSDGTWRAHFTLNNVLWEATFSGTGVLLKSEASR